MLFNSLEFLLLFLPLVLGVARLLRGNALLFWISLSSFVFYAFAGHVWFLIPMAITTVLDYWVGFRIERARSPRRRLAYLVLSVVANLGLLCYFKYSRLIVDTADALQTLFTGSATASTRWSLLGVVLPAGISFYTFQTMSYVIDIYRGKSEPEASFFKYVSFVTFFPHLVAGPLTRHDQLLPQLGAVAGEGIKPRWREGVFLFSIGLCKKVLVADRVANLIDPLIDTLPKQGLLGCWLAVIGYSMQIYFDFSGYSDMAVGLGRLFGIELPQNFNSPYQALNPSEFWARWHITLSRWLRDYLYISLGGNRNGARRTQFNLLITMVLGGLWHGASWTFAAWGLFHGLILVVYHGVKPRYDEWDRRAQRAVTYLLVCVGWTFFRAPTIGDAGRWIRGLFGLHGFGVAAPTMSALPLAILLCGCIIITMGTRNAFERDLRQLALPTVALLAATTAAATLLMNYSSKFLYFQF